MKKILTFLFTLCASVFLLILPVHAGTDYVEDNYGLLSEQEISDLNEYAERVSDTYECGVYIRVMPDNGGYSSVEPYAESLYKEQGLGYGDAKNGVMLVITMAERDYDYLAYGDIGNTAFTDYAKQTIDTPVVSKLSDGDWNGAFNAFIGQCEYILDQNASGNTVDDPVYLEQEHARSSFNFAICCGVPPIISILICLGIRSKNKTKAVKHEASSYIAENSLNLTVAQDIFLTRTETRVHIQENTNRNGGGHSGGTTINSGGFSHHSGKF